MMFINVYYDGSHNDIACISLSLTPFGESPYICMHDMCVSARRCMCVHMDANVSLCIIILFMSMSVCTCIICYNTIM